MTKIIIANVIALIASLIMVYSGILKNKKKILYYQSVQILLSVISNIILGGITGAIINVVGFIRNIICYKDKLGLKEKIIISVVATILTLRFNNLAFIGLLPLISTIVYIWLMNIKDVVKFKLLICFTMIVWFIYDLTIKSYTAAIFDLMTIISNCYSIYKINKVKFLKM